LLGETFAAAIGRLADQSKCNLANVSAVGMSGHTLWHETESRYPSTMSLGMAEVVAEKTGLTAVSDFRCRDVVLGGQGYPLTTLIDYRMFHRPDEDRLLIHLGGYATVTWVPADGGPSRCLGFQAAPCGLLLDSLMRHVTGGRDTVDAGGKHAVQGRCIDPLLERWLAHPFFQRRPPKSCPRSEFGHDFIEQGVRTAKDMDRSLHDVLCTATHLVVRAVVQGCQRFFPWPPARVLVSGGAVRNGFLWRLLQTQLRDSPLEKTDQHGSPAEARKALAFAGLAALTLDGVPVNIPAVTGAAATRLVGHLTPGSFANWSRCLAWMAAQSQPLAVAA
jgi:anhydro-N-acetylmuramic acid kinase